jgi:23S rRNA-/tRNA-specific pseudouridylate synthase
VLLARDAQTAARWSLQLQRQEFTKVYLARVLGDFPSQPVRVSAPIACVSRQRGQHAVSPTGKAASSLFSKLSYNGHTSLVQCQPLTGRTHQLRIHLQHAGYAIYNDCLYGGQLYPSNTYSCSSTALQGERREDCMDCRLQSYYTGQRRCLSIALHASRYSGPGFSFEAPLPDWAADDFDTQSEPALPD